MSWIWDAEAGASLHYLEEHMGLFMQGVEADASLCDAVKILYGDASTLPAEEESVDGILMECSFSRMEQPEQVLKECIRVLKPGGCLAVSDMIACGEEIIPEDFPHDAGTRAFLGRLEYAETVAARITRAGSASLQRKITRTHCGKCGGRRSWTAEERLSAGSWAAPGRPFVARNVVIICGYVKKYEETGTICG